MVTPVCSQLLANVHIMHFSTKNGNICTRCSQHVQHCWPLIVRIPHIHAHKKPRKGNLAHRVVDRHWNVQCCSVQSVYRLCKPRTGNRKETLLSPTSLTLYTCLQKRKRVRQICSHKVNQGYWLKVHPTNLFTQSESSLLTKYAFTYTIVTACTSLQTKVIVLNFVNTTKVVHILVKSIICSH